MPKYCGNPVQKFSKDCAKVGYLPAALPSFAQTLCAASHSLLTFTQLIRQLFAPSFAHTVTVVKGGLSAVSTPPIITTTLSDNLNYL